MKEKEYKSPTEICEKKVSYETDELAWIAAYEVYIKYKHEQRPYLCVQCGNYHLRTGLNVLPNWLIKRLEDNPKEINK